MAEEEFSLYYWKWGISHAVARSDSNWFVKVGKQCIQMAVDNRIESLDEGQQGYLAGGYNALVEKMPMEKKAEIKSNILEIVGEENFKWLEDHIEKPKLTG
jgi:hypothetical protein